MNLLRRSYSTKGIHSSKIHIEGCSIKNISRAALLVEVDIAIKPTRFARPMHGASAVRSITKTRGARGENA